MLASPPAIARAGNTIHIASLWDTFGNHSAALLVILPLALGSAFVLAAYRVSTRPTALPETWNRNLVRICLLSRLRTMKSKLAPDTSERVALAISGSLRAASLNTAMLSMAIDCAPPGLTVQLYIGLGELPAFNPDLEFQDFPAVVRLHHLIADADALLIASPEYAHGVSGVMKNALDWIVASDVMVHKPVALWNAAPRASHAIVALRETLTVMSARLVDTACLDLLIRAAAPGQPVTNPDPAAMRGALLSLQRELQPLSRDQRRAGHL